MTTATIEQTPALRASGIGGSDAAAIVGLSRWKTAVEVYLEKIGEAPPVEETQAMHFGKVLEQVVADEFTRLTGLPTRRYSTNETLRHKDFPHIMGHIDRKIEGAHIGLECKTAGKYYSAEEWGETGTDLVPADYLLQCQHYMLVTGWHKWHLAVLLAGNEFRHYEINRDEAIMTALLEKENHFWKLVEARTPPAPASTFDTKLLYPRDRGESVIATQEILDAIIALNQYTGELKAKEYLIEDCKTRIQSYMKDAARLIDMQGKQLATWNTENGGARLDQKALAADHPEIAASYTRQTERRVFRAKKEKS